MIPSSQLAQAQAPGEDAPLVLTRRGAEFTIWIGSRVLMSSATHGSEEALAELTCERIASQARARVLIGGLGMGYTLARALSRLAPSAEVEVAELIPAVVEWNRGPLKDLAGRPLEDRRVSVWRGDVADRIRATTAHYDAIVLDIDNGPSAITRATNDWLYSLAGLAAAFAALRDGGVLGVWSVAPDREFARRLVRVGFRVEQQRVRARRTSGGRHVILLGTRGARA